MKVRHRRFLLSTVALCVGWYLFIARMAQVIALMAQFPQSPVNLYVHNALLGIQVILGVCAYRSKKRVRLGIVTQSKIRSALEFVCLILVIAVSVVFYAKKAASPGQMILKTYIMYQPAYVVNDIIVPLWVVIAYVIMNYKNVKPLEE